MVRRPDFIIDDQGSQEANIKLIFQHLIGRKIKAGMPVVIIVIGKSRTGKTMWALKLQDWLYEYFKLDFAKHVRQCVLLTPEDWVDGFEKILDKDPSTKDQLSTHLDEAKFVISTDNWQSQFNEAVRAGLGVTSKIKVMAYIIVAQLRKDVDPRVRETADYRFVVTRSPQNKPKIRCQAMYEMETDMSTVKVKPRNIRGMIRRKDGSYRYIRSLIVRPTLPRQEIVSIYNQFEEADKIAQLRNKLNKMRKQQMSESGAIDRRLDELANILVNNPVELERIGHFTKSGKWHIKKNVTESYNYTPHELKQLEKKVMERYNPKVRVVEVISNAADKSEVKSV